MKHEYNPRTQRCSCGGEWEAEFGMCSMQVLSEYFKPSGGWPERVVQE